ncbi:hypothetical protein Francci3_1246 [Frankia casuarinae]|uniref:Uncharacterized protein n=1 Tax=Frankia casuarinae (strain DSM 45818 / CECT 9043 / HFP020203 / CcI3) TaxID=106370 RepID=Q2JDL8_FRACC|nr:hypothetical protein Francci3_1246 [Frankia casuarinae]
MVGPAAEAPAVGATAGTGFPESAVCAGSTVGSGSRGDAGFAGAAGPAGVALAAGSVPAAGSVLSAVSSGVEPAAVGTGPAGDAVMRTSRADSSSDSLRHWIIK